MDDKKTAWERLQIIHTKGRPTIRDYIPLIFTDFYEMHGDRLFGDDKAIIGGIARLDNRPVTIIAEVKGRDINENKSCNFAMPHPEGYRKALPDQKTWAYNCQDCEECLSKCPQQIRIPNQMARIVETRRK